MPLTLAQRIDRLDVRVAELESWKVRERRPLALAFDGAPIAVGAPWPRADGVVRFVVFVAKHALDEAHYFAPFA